MNLTPVALIKSGIVKANLKITSSKELFFFFFWLSWWLIFLTVDFNYIPVKTVKH